MMQSFISDLIAPTLLFLSVGDVAVACRVLRWSPPWHRWAEAFVGRPDPGALRLAHRLRHTELHQRALAVFPKAFFNYPGNLRAPVDEDLALAAWIHAGGASAGPWLVRRWLEAVSRWRLFRLLEAIRPTVAAVDVGWWRDVLLYAPLRDGDFGTCDLVWKVMAPGRSGLRWLYDEALRPRPNRLALAWIGSHQRMRCDMNVLGLSDNAVIVLTETLGARRVKFCRHCVRLFVYPKNFGSRAPWTHRRCPDR